jgi:hypothetical protein
LAGPIVLKRAIQGPKLLLKKFPVLGLLLQVSVAPRILSVPLLGLLRCKMYLVLDLLLQQSEEAPALSLHLPR